MEITKTMQDDVCVIALDGRLDTNTSVELDKVLEELEPGDLTFDFAKLKYISSRGLRSMLAAQKTANKNKTQMLIINASDAVKEVFEITGFSSMIEIQ